MNTDKHRRKRIPLGPFVPGSERPVEVRLKPQHGRVCSCGLCVRAWALMGLVVLLAGGFALRTPAQEGNVPVLTPETLALESAHMSEPAVPLAEERGGDALLLCLGFVYLCGAALFTLAVMKTASEANRRACTVATDWMHGQGLAAGHSNRNGVTETC